jgi:transcriptional regulator with XRE-family HTH domain
MRVIRKNKGLKMVQLAELTGIHIADLSKVETGERRPFPGWRRRIAEALETPEAELFPSEAEQP